MIRHPDKKDPKKGPWFRELPTLYHRDGTGWKEIEPRSVVALTQRQLNIKERFNTLPEPAPRFFLCRNSGSHTGMHWGLELGDARLRKLPQQVHAFCCGNNPLTCFPRFVLHLPVLRLTAPERSLRAKRSLGPCSSGSIRNVCARRLALRALS